MKKCAHTKMSKSAGLLLLRLAIGSIFMVHGYMKLQSIDGTTGFFETLGLPMASVMAYLVGLVEFVGGIMIILGVMTCVAAAALSIVMLVAIFTVHLDAGLTGPGGKELPLALLGGLLALVGAGSGKFTVMKAMACDCGNKVGMSSCCSGDKDETKSGCNCGGSGSCGCGDKK